MRINRSDWRFQYTTRCAIEELLISVICLAAIVLAVNLLSK